MTQKGETFVGREAELKQIFEALKNGKHILLFGEKGCGKTALANEFVKQVSQKNPKTKILFSTASASLKDTCIELIGCLYRQGLLVKIPKILQTFDSALPWEKVQWQYAKLRTTVLRNLVLNNIRAQKNVVILDHLGKLKLKYFVFLDNLRDCAKLFLIVRSPQKEEVGRLWMMLWGFEKVEVKSFNPDETKRLASHWLDRMPENSKWVREILRVSHGNPGILHGLCDEIRKQNTSIGTVMNVKIANHYCPVIS